MFKSTRHAFVRLATTGARALGAISLGLGFGSGAAVAKKSPSGNRSPVTSPLASPVTAGAKIATDLHRDGGSQPAIALAERVRQAFAAPVFVNDTEP